MAGRLAVWILLLPFAVALAHLDVIRVSGRSMEETLRDGDRVLVLRMGRIPGLPFVSRDTVRRGDVVAFRDPVVGGRVLVKRIVGVPGDRVRLLAGELLLNGAAQPQARTVKRDGASWPTLEGAQGPPAVPPGHYLVLSDNRPVGIDSRLYGPVRQEAVLGVVLGVISRAKTRGAR